MTDFELTPQDRQSALWLRLKQCYEDRLIDLRMKNDARMPEIDRAELVGQIVEVKRLLDLDQEDIPMTP